MELGGMNLVRPLRGREFPKKTEIAETDLWLLFIGSFDILTHYARGTWNALRGFLFELTTSRRSQKYAHVWCEKT